MLHFVNNGSLDIRCITTMGVNAKSTDSAIGYFGTGLKYAIACILREGGSIVINANGNEINFELAPDTVNGKVIPFIQMKEWSKPPVILGFTADLGKHWQPWMVYRELYVNCKDEGGSVCTSWPFGPSDVIISVAWEPLAQAHADRADFLLGERKAKLLWANEQLEVYEGESVAVFCNGIRVIEKSGLKCCYTYNVLGEWPLTEDRTLLPYNFEVKLPKIIQSSKMPQNLLERIFTAPAWTVEHDRPHWTSYNEWNSDTLEVAVDLLNSRQADLSARLKFVLETLGFDFTPEQVDLCRLERFKLQGALALLEKHGCGTDMQVTVVKSLGRHVATKRKQEKLFITQESLEKSLAEVVALLAVEIFEEQEKIQSGSKEMEEFLLKKLMKSWSKLDDLES